MDQAQARALLAAERTRLQRLLQAETIRPQAAELGDEVDDADRRNAEQTGMAVDQLLRARWAALRRAEALAGPGARLVEELARAACATPAVPRNSSTRHNRCSTRLGEPQSPLSHYDGTFVPVRPGWASGSRWWKPSARRCQRGSR
jgi:hypothetical protein